MDHIEQLVQRYKETGDQVIARAIYMDLQTYTFRLAYGFLGDKEDADDVSQAAWIKAFNNIEKYDPRKRAFKTWLTVMIRNKCIDLLRSKGLRKMLSLEWLLKKRSDPIDQSLSLEGQMTRNEVWEAIQALPRAEREVIILRDYFEYKWRDIALILKCSMAMAHYRHQRGYERLRGMLDGTYLSDFGEDYE